MSDRDREIIVDRDFMEDLTPGSTTSLASYPAETKVVLIHLDAS
jgi:hypothetical protein